jgi:hypothetical protein
MVTDSSGQAAAGNSTPTAAVAPPLTPCTRPIRASAATKALSRGTFSSDEQTGRGTIPAPTTSLPFISPFPIIRSSGRFRGQRTKLTRVVVNAPRGVRIRIACKGRGCPYRRKAIAVKQVRGLQRVYRLKATIETRVTQPQKIGRYTRIEPGRGNAPRRIDCCLMPGMPRPVKCPTA